MLVGIDLESSSLAADLLDCICGFELFVNELRRDGPRAKGASAAIADLVELFCVADERNEDLSLLGAFVPDLLYIRLSELQILDRWTRIYADTAPRFLLDQLRVRGVCSFYILDNSIRQDRFDLLVEIAEEVGFHIISPNFDGASEVDLLTQIEGAQMARHHILYVERDASVNHLDAVRSCPKRPCYTVAFRNQAPTVNQIEILQLASGTEP